jgi:hypothetical protein
MMTTTTADGGEGVSRVAAGQVVGLPRRGVTTRPGDIRLTGPRALQTTRTTYEPRESLVCRMAGPTRLFAGFVRRFVRPVGGSQAAQAQPDDH